MKIIIVGCGIVGYSIAKQLASQRHDLVLIDQKGIDVEAIDALVIQGSGLSTKVLHAADAKTADLIICATDSDETNILCCITAKKLGTRYGIARIRNPEYALELAKLKQDLGIDMIINPELQTALEISRLLRFPAANNIDTFAGGRVELISFRVGSANVLAGKTVEEAFKKVTLPVLLAALERDGEIFVPRSDTVINAGDYVRILGRAEDNYGFMGKIGVLSERIDDVTIIGGGRIARYLIEDLQTYNKNVRVLERDIARAEQLATDFPKSIILNAEGMDEKVLNQEEIANSDAVVCLTSRDEENVMIALYLNQNSEVKTVVKVNALNMRFVKNLGLDRIVCPKKTTANTIATYVRALGNSFFSSNIETMHIIGDPEKSSIEALEFNITSGSRCLNTPLKDLRIKKSILIGCIVRKGEIIIPSGMSQLLDGDNVIVFVEDASLYDIDDILEDSPVGGPQ